MGRIRHARLIPTQGEAFRAMTFPSFRDLMALEPTLLFPQEAGRRPVAPFAVGAFLNQAADQPPDQRPDETPIALALGAASEGTRTAELLSLYVLPALRRRGVATHLLAEFERAAREEALRSLFATYMTGKVGSEIFERMIARAAWSEPQTRTLTLKTTVEETKQTDWFRRDYLPREGLEFFPWKDLTASEEAALRASHEREPWIPDDLIPWQYGPCEPLSSVGANYNGAVVGWIVNHALDATTVRLTCGFVHRDLARFGGFVPLLVEMVRRLDSSPYTHCTSVTPVEHRRMIRFIRRRWAPWVGFCGETRGAFKVLTGAG